MYIAILLRDETIQYQVRCLMQYLPYPMSWYAGLKDHQITAIYRDNLPKLCELAIAHDDVITRQKLETQMDIDLSSADRSADGKQGRYKVLNLNRCSLRFKYIANNGKEVQGLVAAYIMRGYDLSEQTSLYGTDVEIQWQTGKRQVMTKQELIRKVNSSVSPADDGSMIRAIQSLERTVKAYRSQGKFFAR